MIDNPFLQSLEATKKQFDKALCHLFAGKIKANVLLDIKRRIQVVLGDDIKKYFDFNLSAEKIIAGMDDAATIDYEICRYIVGIHSSNLIFLSDTERVAKEKSVEYREQIVNAVIEHIKLRPYAGILFRKYPIMQGENFIFFPLPYDLFAISIRINRILAGNKTKLDSLRPLYIHIANKGLAALSMLEDNFLDNASKNVEIMRGASPCHIG